MARIREYTTNARIAKRYNSTVFPHPIRKDDLGAGGNRIGSIHIGTSRWKSSALHLEYNYFEKILQLNTPR
ncbi:hypothetical protein CR513_47780, partial [Mucuna pruriens]